MLKVQRTGTINKKNVIQIYSFALTCDPCYSNLKQKNYRQHDHPSLMSEDINTHKNTDLTKNSGNPFGTVHAENQSSRTHLYQVSS